MSEATRLTPINDTKDYPIWDDLSTMKTLTCKNHPTARYSTKNPWIRNLHIIRYPEGLGGECSCPFSDLCLVEKID